MTDATDSASAKAIRERLLEKGRAYHDRDCPAVMDIYLRSEEICIFDLPPPAQYFGHAAVDKLIGEFIDGAEGPLRIDYMPGQVEASGDLGVSWSLVRIETQLKAGPAIDVIIRQTDVWKRVNGQWYVIHEHNSLPLQEAEANRLFSLDPDTMNTVPVERPAA
jgi:ketosteroid isomerase-like protein